MSQTHDIDNEEALFQFDTYESLDSSRLSIFSPHTMLGAELGHLVLSDDSNTSHRAIDSEERLVQVSSKGKGVSRPVPIGPHTSSAHDVFDMSSPSSSTSAPSTAIEPSMGMSPSSSDASSFDVFDLSRGSHGSTLPNDPNVLLLPAMTENEDDTDVHLWKGKQRELPPTLPPLTFSPTEFNYSSVDWTSLRSSDPTTPGPSSYGSAYGSLIVNNAGVQSITSQHAASSSSANFRPLSNPPIIRRIPSRRRSLSNLSSRSERSIAARSMSRIRMMKFDIPRASHSLTRKLLFRKREDVSISDVLAQGSSDSGRVYSFESPKDVTARYADAATEVAAPMIPRPPTTGLNLDDRTLLPSENLYRPLKTRSYSSPLPFSALDIVSYATDDLFAPIPIIIRNYFEEILPQELQLQVLAFMVALYQSDHERAMRDSNWSVAKASSPKNRWVGKEKGVRELVKLSRVSKHWQTLVFDGQLWAELDLRSFPKMPTSLILRLAGTGGRFVRTLDITGNTNILPTTFIDMTDNLCLQPAPPGIMYYTQLTTINLERCSQLTTRSLHHILMRSPLVQKLSVKGIGAVTNTTCDVLAVYCPKLTLLEMSRCPNMDGDGIRALAAAAVARRDHLRLKELRLSGLRHIDDSTMATLGKAAPYLEVLDLSYIRHLHNSAIEAFVSCDEGDESDLGVDTITLTAREVGREQGYASKYRRRITRIRHLSLSACILLTDVACANLAYTVPKLEFLELAAIGAELRDEGLIRLLNTTPFVKRIDLEDATAITDSVIAALTPSVAEPRSLMTAQPSAPEVNTEPGHALEHLIVSYAGDLTDAALLSLIRGCTRLRILEADNTRMSGSVLKEFVRLSRKRRIADAKIVAIDCRSVGEGVVKDVVGMTRPRIGWRSYESRKMRYVDGRDDVAEDLKIGQDECDERRVVVKTFYSWQTVDAVAAAREKRRKSNSRRLANESSGTSDDDGAGFGRSTRWWSPSGRSSRARSATNSPTLTEINDRDGCAIM